MFTYIFYLEFFVDFFSFLLYVFLFFRNGHVASACVFLRAEQIRQVKTLGLAAASGADPARPRPTSGPWSDAGPPRASRQSRATLYTWRELQTAQRKRNKKNSTKTWKKWNSLAHAPLWLTVTAHKTGGGRAALTAVSFTKKKKKKNIRKLSLSDTGLGDKGPERIVSCGCTLQVTVWFLSV